MYLAFDTETTGVHDNAEIAQFAAILFDKDWNIMSQHKTLVKPDGWTMSDEMAAWHKGNGSNISQEACEKFGMGIISVIGLFNNLCAKASMLIGHNVKYDLARMRYSASRTKTEFYIPHRSLCTQEESTPLVKLPPTEKMIKAGRGNQYKSPKLSEVYEFFFHEKIDGAHDALADVKACSRIAQHIMSMKAAA